MLKNFDPRKDVHCTPWAILLICGWGNERMDLCVNLVTVWHKWSDTHSSSERQSSMTVTVSIKPTVSYCCRVIYSDMSVALDTVFETLPVICLCCCNNEEDQTYWFKSDCQPLEMHQCIYCLMGVFNLCRVLTSQILW